MSSSVPKPQIKKTKRKKGKRDPEYPLNNDIEVSVKFGTEFTARLPEVGEPIGEDKAILVKDNDLITQIAARSSSTRSASIA